MTDPLHPTDAGEDATVEGAVEAEAPVLARGTSVGRYTVLELLGRGGMGAVYKAYDPELDRLIALKVIAPHSSGNESTLQAHGRMMREAQALAQLSHPNVVAVHDVGKYEGSVYIAMELVEGKTGREWLKEERPSRGEILAVFRQAGEGLLAAHEAGLVHRDFKPANMILGKDGRVRVADFGLVRSLSAPPPPEMEPVVRVGALQKRKISVESGKYLSASLTQSQSILGTPHYMSPEQCLGKAIDGRADQYSFCVCLFEALYGEKPFHGRDFGELLENVVDGRRKAPPDGALVPEWLRVIVEKGLSREASDRYPSMRELLDALLADPEKAAKQAREARRRSIKVAFGLGAALASGVVLTMFFLAREKELCQGGKDLLRPVWNEEVKARVREAFVAAGRPYAGDTYERVAGHLDRWAGEWVVAHTEACEATHIKGQQSEKVLDLRMGCLERKLRSLQALVGVFAGKPDGQVVDKAVEAALGLGGLAFCADVKALTEQEEPPEKLEDRQTLAELRGRLEEVNQLQKLGKYREADSLLKELAPRVLALRFPPLRAELAYHTAKNLERLGKFAEAEPVFAESIQTALQSKMLELAALAGSEATYLVGHKLQRHAEGLLYSLHAQGLTRGRGDEVEALALYNLANVYYSQGRYQEAEEIHKRVLAIREKVFGPDHPEVAKSLNNLGIVTDSQGKSAEAEELYKKALAIWEKVFGPDHPDVARAINNLAIIYRNQGKFREAEELLKRALAIWEKVFGPDHPTMADSLNNLAMVYYSQGKNVEAEELHKKALAIKEKAVGPDHPSVAVSLINLALACQSQGKYGEAEVLYKKALAIQEKSLGPDHPELAWALTWLGETHAKQHRLAEALPLLERASAIREKAAVASKERATTAFALARVLWAIQKDRARARSLAQKALELYQTVGAGSEKQRREVEVWLDEHK